MKIKLSKPVKIALFLNSIINDPLPEKEHFSYGVEYVLHMISYGIIRLILSYEEIHEIRKLYIEGKLFYE